MSETDLQLGGGYAYQWECAILLALNYFFEPVRYNPTLFDLVNDFLGQIAEIHLEGEDRESGVDLEDINLVSGDRRILIQVKTKQAEGERWTPTDPLLLKALYRFYDSRFLAEQPEDTRFVFLSNRPFNRTLVRVKSAIKKGAVDQCAEADKLCQYLDRYADKEKGESVDADRCREMLARTALVEYLDVDEVKANVQAKLQAHGRRDWEEAHALLFEHFARQSTCIGGSRVTCASVIEVLGPPASVQLKEQLDQSLKESTQAILTSQARTDQSVAEYGDKILERISSYQTEVVIDEELSSEYQAQLDQVQDLLRAFQPKLALEHLHALKDRIWDKAHPNDKFRLLTYMGFAHLQLNEEPEAAQMFIDAVDFNRESAKAICNAALGFLLQGESRRCEKLAREALGKDPTVEQAYAMLIYSSSEDETLESILAKVPEVHRNTLEVSMALGKLVWQRDLLPEAEHWFRVAVETDTQDHPDPRGTLADLLLTKLRREDAVLEMRGIINPNATLATEAIELYDHAWERVSRTEIRSLKLGWLVNRATAKVLLDDEEGAIQDIDEALRDNPDDPYIVRHRAMLAHRTRDLPKAAALFRQILDAKEIADAKFWLSAVLFEDGKLNEAATLAQEFLEQAELPPSAERDATRLLVWIKLQAGDLGEAKTMTDSLRRDFPDDPGVLALCARVARYEGRGADAEALLAEAQTKLTPDVGLITCYRLIGELYESEKFEAAADLLAKVVDTQVDSAPTRQLLDCYYRSGNLQPALEICKTLREKHGPLRFITEMESAIYEEIGDLDMAKRVCQEYLESFPDDLGIQLRLAVVNYRLKEFEDLDRFLDQDIDIGGFTFEGCAQLAHLYLAGGRVRRALEIAYEARRRFFTNPEAHLAYVRIFIRRGSEQDDWLDADRVSIDSAVCIDGWMGISYPWIIIEDRDDDDIRPGEFTPSHPLVRQLLNKEVGDSISLSYGLSTQEITIKEISSKFVYAFNETCEAYQLRFPDTPGIWGGQVQVSADGSGSMEGLQPIFDMIDRRYEYIHEAERFYQQGKFPIGSLAGVLGKNPIEVQAVLMAKPDLGVRCCSGRQDERDKAVALIDSNPKLVVDIISLMTLHQLDIGDEIVGTLGKLGIVRSSLELVEVLLSDQAIHAEEYWTLGKEGEQYVRTLVTMEQVEHTKRVLESVVAWAEANCDILPCTAALTVKREARSKLGELIGPSFVETILAAADEYRVLYSDDGPLRELAKVEHGVSSVWTQPVLISLRKRGAISDGAYTESVVKLACLNYRHTSIDDQVLLEAAKQAQWRPVYPFSQVVRILGAESNLDSAITVAAKYVYLLWKQKLLPDQYERLVIAVLGAITSKRARRKQALAAFDREIGTIFTLAPTEIYRIQEIMKAWATAHVL